MIHPRLATMLAVVTTDYPLDPGEADRVPPPRRRRELQPHLRRRRVLDERRGRAARQRRERRRADAERDDEQFAAALGDGVRRARARRSSRTARERRCSSRSSVSGAASDEEAEAIARRIATSPLVKTAAFGRDPNWGRVLAAAGSAPWNGGFAQLDPTALDGRVRRHRGLRARRADRARCRVSTGAAVAIELDLGLGDGAGVVPRVRPHLRLRPPERGVHDVTPCRRSSSAGASRPMRRATPSSSRRRARGRRRPRRRPADHRRAARARDPGRVRATAAASRIQRLSPSCASRWSPSGPRCPPHSAPRRSSSSATRSGFEAGALPELGLVGDPLPCRPPAIETRSREG